MSAVSSINIYRLLRVATVICITVTLIFALFYVAKYTYPFLIALFFALLINPIVNFLEFRLNLNRAVAVIVAIFLLLSIIAGIITLLIVELINGTNYLAEHIPTHYSRMIILLEEIFTHHIIPIYQQIISMFHTLEPAHQKTIISNIQQIGEEIANTGAQLLHTILQKIPVLLGQLPSYVSVLIFSLLGTFFISKDWYKFITVIEKVVPKTITKSSIDVIHGLKKALLGFVKAQITLISITTVIVLIGLVILRVDYAVTIALITGLIDLLPYLGTGLIFIPWIIYMFFNGNYFLTIGLALLYITVVVQRQLMEPKVLSNNIGLNPLATLIALFVGFQLWGLTGLIFGPLILVIINTLIQTGVIHQLWVYIKG